MRDRNVSVIGSFSSHGSRVVEDRSNLRRGGPPRVFVRVSIVNRSGGCGPGISEAHWPHETSRYRRVGTAGQDANLQLDARVDAWVQKRDVFADVTSGSTTDIERPGMK